MRIAICEDEISHQAILENYIVKYKHCSTIEIEKYCSGEELSSSFKQGNRFDIIFLDIRMKKIDGFETAKRIRSFDDKVYIILTTSLIEYAIKGYSFKANDFILKPISESNFLNAFERGLREVCITKKSTYLISTIGGDTLVDINEIYYIESQGRKINIHSKEGAFQQYKSITDEEERLKDVGFIRVHRSYLINMKSIFRIKEKEIQLKNNEIIPMSPKRYKYVYDEFTTFLLGGLK